jgi:hypothetical protein
MIDASHWKRFARISIALLAVLAPVLIFLVTRSFQGSRMDLDIVAHREDAANGSWTVNGCVRQDGNGVAGARVWAIVKANQGDRDSPPGSLTGSDGQFALTNLPKQLGGPDGNVRSIEVHARLTKGGREFQGVEILRPGGMQQLGTTGLAAALASLALVLLLSMLLPILSSRPAYTEYVISMTLAVLFSLSVIGAVGYAMFKMRAANPEPWREVRLPEVGFISIFYGSYVDGGPDQWLVSLSDQTRHRRVSTDQATGQAGTAAQAVAPPTDPAKEAPANPPAASTIPQAGSSESAAVSATEQGFGAPLWVVLLAVVGSGVLTVSLVTREIREPPEDKAEKIREKIYNAVQHQLYVLFSPISAIFVYQTLVMTHTAGQPLVVALATLGAGAALNVLLKRAVDSATALFSTATPPPPNDAAAAAAAGSK